jgi:hypothetical protein
MTKLIKSELFIEQQERMARMNKIAQIALWVGLLGGMIIGILTQSLFILCFELIKTLK